MNKKVDKTEYDFVTHKGISYYVVSEGVKGTLMAFESHLDLYVDSDGIPRPARDSKYELLLTMYSASLLGVTLEELPKLQARKKLKFENEIQIKKEEASKQIQQISLFDLGLVA